MRALARAGVGLGALCLCPPAVAAGGYRTLPASGCPARGDFAHGHHEVLADLPSCTKPSAVPLEGRVIRGGAPTVAGIACLKQQGVTAVIDLRMEGEATGERARVAAAGMRYHAIPMATGGARGPRSCQAADRSAAACNELAVALALAAIQATLAESPDAKVYVHCARGEDRTSLVIAALRLQLQGCAARETEREMKAHFYVPYPPLRAVWEKLNSRQGGAP